MGPDGTLSVLTREAHVIPAINPDANVFEDFVSMVSPEGRPLGRISLLAAFANSDYAAVLTPMGREGDILHANAISVLDGRLAARSPAFRAGNLLVSLRALNVVAVLDPKSGKIVWALSGAVPRAARSENPSERKAARLRQLRLDAGGASRVRVPGGFPPTAVQRPLVGDFGFEVF